MTENSNSARPIADESCLYCRGTGQLGYDGNTDVCICAKVIASRRQSEEYQATLTALVESAVLKALSGVAEGAKGDEK
jgi:hypothetical protein